MKKFIVLYHAPASIRKQAMKLTPGQADAIMNAWIKWGEKCGDQLLDMGAPLVGGVKLTPDGKAVESKRQVSGFSVLKAKSMAEAKKLLKGHPHLSWGGGCAIEVHEAQSLQGM